MTGPTIRADPCGPGGSRPPADPCALVIFGGSGDLARRKLIPALYNLARDGALPTGFCAIGVGRSAQSAGAFRELHEESTAKFSRTPLDEESWQRFAGALDHVTGNVDDPETYARLDAWLAAAERERGTRGNRLFYLATPASVFPVILGRLASSGLLSESASRAPWSRVVIEKPFGRDLASARALDDLVDDVLGERRVFRIDHYLGKETVQNVLVFRFGNAIFEPLWNRKYIDHVQITAAESIGIEGRGAFYDETGVVRDVVQNHLLQVLALCAMEPPVSFAADEVRDQKEQLLRSIRSLRGSVERDVVLGQYRGYRDERGVDRASRTPTYAALRVFIDNWRWQGVPFYLRAGKRLAKRVTEVAVHFQAIPLCLFPRELVDRMERNVITLRIQPDEGITLRFACKVPGDELVSRDVTMDFSYARAFERPVPEAYERLLLDVMRGDATLFWRRAGVERAWEVVMPILEAAEASGPDSVHAYEPGSEGPREADALLERDGRSWRGLS